MSQLVRRIESFSVDELRDMMEERGRELFICSVAAYGDLSNDNFLKNLTEVIGLDGIDDLEEAIEAIEAGEDPFPQIIQSADDTAQREECANAVEKIDGVGTVYAAALRGHMELQPGIDVLLEMLRDQRIKSEWKGRRGDRVPIRLAINAAFTTQAKEAANRRRVLKEEADRLVGVFTACCKEQDLQGMKKAFHKLCHNNLRPALRKKLGSTELLRAMFRAYQKTMDELLKKKAGI